MNVGRDRNDEDLGTSVIPPESKFSWVGIPLVLDRSKISRRDIRDDKDIS